jgi:hypothetical protein
MAGFMGMYNNSRSGAFDKDPEYDASRYQYGGYAGGAQNERANLRSDEGAVEERAAPQMQGTQLNQGDSDQSRGFQMGSLASLQATANGQGPSAAVNLAQQNADRAARAQVSAAGSVRGGPGAQASAYRYAAGNAAQQAADQNQGIQAQRANEIATAQGQLANAATATRGQDLNAATTNAQLGENTQQQNQNAQLQQTGMNDARAQQYEQLQEGVNQDQLKANLEQQQLEQQNRIASNQLNEKTNQSNVDTNKGLFDTVLGLGQGVVGGAGKAIGSLFSSDPNAKLPVGGSLAALGLGGMPSDNGGTVDIGGKGYMSSADILGGASGLAGGGMHGMVNGGGVTGGAVNLGNDGMMPSDENEKEVPQTFGVDEDRSSPTFREWLGRSAKGVPEDGYQPKGGAITTGGSKKSDEPGFLVAITDGIANAHPYDRNPEVAKGVAGAPRGYANGRAAPEEDTVSWSKPSTWAVNQKGGKSLPSSEGQAPGTEDWNRYGASAKPGDEPNWNRGGEIAKPGEGPGVFESILGGIANAHPFYAVPQRDTTTSDEEAKVAAAAVRGAVRGATDSKGGAAGKVTSAAEDHKAASEASAKELMYAPLVMSPEQSAVFGGFRAGHALWHKADELATRADDEEGEPKKAPPPEFSGPLSAELGASLNASRGAGLAKVYGEPGTSAYIPSSRPEHEEPTWADRVRSFFTSDQSTKEGFEQVPDREMAAAMRSMKPAVYAYKPDYTPPDQYTGEVNVGPMANAMARNPVARTAIVEDPSTGLLAIDKGKAERVIMGSLASLQHQIDDLEPARKKRRSDAVASR